MIKMNGLLLLLVKLQSEQLLCWSSDVHSLLPACSVGSERKQ